MRWFDGSIESAIALAKQKNAIFVVYCSGKDQNSEELTKLLNADSVSSRLKSESFVAVKIDSDQPEYAQFCKIYQLVPVPSIFFIKNGVPIKVITSVMKSSDAIVEAIDSILKSHSSSTSAKSSGSSTQQFLSAEVASSSTSQSQSDEIVCEGDVCYKKESKPETEVASEPSRNSSDKTEDEVEAERQEKIRHAMKMIEEKRAEKLKEEEQKEKEREIQRRKEGQELVKLKQWQDEQQMKQLKEDRMKEKLEAQAARKRVLDQIAQDKMERAQRFQQFTSPTVEQPTPTQPQATTPSTPPPNSTRIQFKKPDGESEVVTFDTSMLFADLHAFVKSDVLKGSNIKNFSLATTFPRREFTSEDFNKTLIDLNLVPSSVILIIPVKGKSASSSPSSNVFNPSSVLPTQTDGSFFDMISALIMGLFSPVFALFAYVGRIITGNRNDGGAADEGFGDAEADVGKRKRNEETLTPNDAAKRRNLNTYFSPPASDDQPGTSSGAKTAYKRGGNKPSKIHRLHEDSDSDEDRKTWNGNSTQQM